VAAVLGTDPVRGSSGGSDSVRVMARAAGLLFLCGATVGAISVLLPHSAGADDPGLWSNIVLAYLGAAGLLVWGQRLPRWCFHVAIAVGTLVVSRAVYLSDDPGTYYAAWYVWVGLYTFFFFNRAQAAAHISLIALCYAVILVNNPGDSGAARWVTMVTTLLVAGAFISVLVRRVREQAEESARDAANLGAIAQVAHRLSGETDVDATRHAICEAALSIADGNSAALWEPTAESSGLTVTTSLGGRPDVDLVHFVAGRSGPTRAFSSGESVFIADFDAAPEVARAAADPATRSCLWEPVMRNDEPTAVLAIGWTRPVAELSDSVAAVLALLAGEAGAAMERAQLLSRLEAVARTDDLTGLRNRRAWEEELPRELARAERDGGPLSVAMLDLDHFKRFNDRRGHQAGDRLLKQAASAWSGRLRVIDVLARYGGEEFALALPGCALDDALALVEGLRSATPGGQTCSAGVASWDGSEGPEELLGRADRALYSAKHAGRDRTVGAGSDRADSLPANEPR
jgi:diguanylate cyclase (GGDEF)-like protein